MILGIGTDLCNIERIEGTLERFGDRFLHRVFTEREQRKAASRPRAVAATYAKRWAAKEACSKALGTGLRMGIAWKDMAVSNLRTGQPVMHLTGWAKALLLMPNFASPKRPIKMKNSPRQCQAKI